MNFKNLKTGTKILSGFSLVALIAAIIGIIGVVSLNNVGKSFHEVSDVRMPSVEYLGKMEANLEKVQKGYIELLDNNLTRSERREILEEIEDYRSEYQHYNDLFAPLDQTEKEAGVYDEMLKELEEWREINTEQVEKRHEDFMERDIMDPKNMERSIERFMKEHYALQVQAMNAIQDMESFRGGDDHTACNFGQWLNEYNTNNDVVNRVTGEIEESHRNFHDAVSTINQYIQQGDREAAMDHYVNSMVPAEKEVFSHFESINKEAEAAVEDFEQMSDALSNESKAAEEKTMALFKELQDINTTIAEEETEKGDEVIASSNAMVYGGIIIGVVLAMILGIVITRLITAGVKQGVGIAEKLAEGDLTVNVDEKLVNQKDEIGQLAKAMQKMVGKLRDLISNVKDGADNIAAASQQMSSGSQEMSQGSSEQASSAEEVSSSMEEMTSNIQQNTDNAKQTEQISQKAAERIRQGNEASQQSVQSMRDIADKITIINDIAFQTNILALNAAVEAARAGEYGKGFAVVAEEVRKLAERSAEAASEIDEKSKSGVEISEKAGKELEEIVPEIEKTSKLVQEITAASNEMNSGAEQVNSAIQQLNQVTQQNASSSEELATSAEELSSQAEQLQQLVNYFKVDEDVMKKQQRGKRHIDFAHMSQQAKQQQQQLGQVKTKGQQQTQQKQENTGYAAGQNQNAAKASNSQEQGVNLDMNNQESDSSFEKY
ncbi:MAG: methyl-accepting chemotaxis protein [Bacteroidota bacterium]